MSLNAGQHRPSWFDIRSLPPASNEWDGAAIASSVSSVEAWIQAEVHSGIDPRRIVLMGFSQGAALSLLVALTTLHELGGVISLGGWIPHCGREVSASWMVPIWRALTSPQQIVHTEPYLPIFCGHGRSDAEIPTYYSEETMAFLRDVLRLPSAFLTFRRYEGLGHAVNNAEMCDVVMWLQSVLGLRPVTRGM